MTEGVDEEEDLFSLEWIQQLFRDEQKQGKRPNTDALRRLHYELSFYGRIYRNRQDISEATYPAHDAARLLQPLVDAAWSRWADRHNAEPRNQLAVDAMKALSELSRLLRDAPSYIEQAPPPDYDTFRIEMAKALGEDPKRVRLTAHTPMEILLVKAADAIERALLEAGN